METNEKLRFGYNPNEYKKFTHYAWRYLIMFSLLYCCFYCMRLNLSNASAMMMTEMGWDKGDIGILTSTLFWTYGFGHLFNGRISEIFGPTRFVVAAVILSFTANILMGLSSSLVVMAVIWGFNGYFQSMAWTPGLATITKWWPGSRRGFAAGFAHAFSGFGQALVTLAVAGAYELSNAMGWGLGWRVAFLLPPLIPLVMLIIYKLIAKPTPTHIGLKEYIEDDPQKAKAEEEMQDLLKTKGKLYPYKHVLSNKKFVIWMFIAFATGLARYGLVTWVPLYFLETFDVPVTESLLGSLALPVGMAVGTLTVPSLTDKFCPTNRLPAVILSSLASAIMIFAFLLFDPRNFAQLIIIEILLFFAGFGIYAINGLAFASATDVGGRVFSGTTSGIMDFSLYMGAAAQSLVYGFVSETIGWNWVFITIAIFCGLIALLAVLGSAKTKRS